MHNISIERIGSAQILEKAAGLLVEAYNAPPWNDEWTQEKALEKLLCFYQSPRFIGWTAMDNDRLVGCCVGNIEPYYTGDYYYLKEMFVSVSSQRSGIGTLLMNAVKSHLESIDIQTIILFTSKDNFPFGFYLNHGFGEMDGMRMMHFGSGG